MNKFRLGMIGFSAIVSFILAYSGIPLPIKNSQTLCALRQLCPYISQWTFLANGAFDFMLFFVVLILISEFVIVPRLERLALTKA